MTRSARRLSMAAILAAALAAIPAVAAAHVHLVSTTPEAGANLDEAPTEVTIEFDGELDPDHSSFTVTDADGTEVGSGAVDLTVADRNVLTGAVTITEPGVYTVAWEVTGLDGHAISGTFSFGFDTDEAIPEPTEGEEHEEGSPDTAMALPGPEPMTLAGLALLALAAVTALPAMRRRPVR
ncbi:MAG TPA: copper resistance CopC family protein [candidate division Zixibacteria bacterium]|nr:copper resistance CopC family protein [candidate division Zixibacteria bacterium]